jgi:iron(III) transport system ATP-binding protein
VSSIDIVDAHKKFGSTSVLDGVTLAVPEGSLTAILGSSGSGKTTLLRIIAGFERLDAGILRLDGALIDDGRTIVHAQSRGIGYVPQDGALFPHLTAAANVAFGLSRRNRAQALDYLDMVGLAGFADRRPHELSGGQQQRVALARALAVQPRVVLLDEPFSSLDASLRVSVRQDVARILSAAGTTTIVVTHDQDEALSMSDQVAVLSAGRILASSDPRGLYLAPPNATAAGHLGEINVLQAEMSSGAAVCALGTIEIAGPAAPTGELVLVRAEQVRLHNEPIKGSVAARVRQFDYYGHDALVRLVLEADPDVPLVARVAGTHPAAAGDLVWLTVEGKAVALGNS